MMLKASDDSSINMKVKIAGHIGVSVLMFMDLAYLDDMKKGVWNFDGDNDVDMDKDSNPTDDNNTTHAISPLPVIIVMCCWAIVALAMALAMLRRYCQHYSQH